MIAKLSMGKGFKGLLQYLFSEDKEPKLLHTYGVRAEQQLDQLLNDFLSIAKQNKKVQKPVWHFSLSFSPEDKPRLTDGFMVEVAQRFLAKMGIGDNQFAIIKHSDTNHPHIHIAVNRVDFEGRVLQNKQQPKLRAMSAAQQLEEEYELVQARRKSKGYSTSVNHERYNFKPPIDLISRKMKQVFTHTLDMAFTDIGQFKSELENNNMTIGERPIKGSSTNYTAVEYSYTYYDNQQKKYIDTTSSMPLSKIKKLNPGKLNEILQKNGTDADFHKGDVVSIINDSLKSKAIEKDSGARHIMTLLSLAGVDIKKRYVLDGINASKLSKKSKEQAHQLIKEGSMLIQALDLKKKLFSGIGQIAFNSDLTFSFNKVERSIIDRSKLNKFYDDYLTMWGFEKGSPVAKILMNKQANSDTIKFISNQLLKTELPFNDVKVDTQIVKTAMVLAHSTSVFLANKTLDETNKARKAIFNFSLYNDNFDDLCIYMARRGFKVSKKKGNIHVYQGETDLGLITSLGYRDAKKHSPLVKLMTEEDLDKAYDLNFNEKNIKFYRLLDQFDIKRINSKLKQGEKFQLDNFDINHLPENLAKDLKSSFSVSEARGGGGTRTILTIKPALKKATKALSRSLIR
jgi:hypothetical protein